MPDLAPCVGLKLEGATIEIIGLDGPTPDRSFLCRPSASTVLGGIPVFSGEHVWMADNQTPESHKFWPQTLERIYSLSPETVIPGHRMPEDPCLMETVDFTGTYIRAYDEETARAGNSQDLINAMTARFPGLAALSNLELSAKVSMGEMQWD